MRSLVALLTISLGSIASAQRTWIVDSRNGTGTDFTDIPPAITAAAPGDTILVRGPGPYSSFVLSKALVVEAVAAANCPEITIHALPAGMAARVVGFVVQDRSPLPFFGHVAVTSCLGSVVLSRLNVVRGLFPSEVIRVQDSSPVLIVDCTATVSSTTNSTITELGALVVERSRVAVQRCRIVGASGFDTCSMPPTAGDGAAGIRSIGSSVLVVDSTVTGGNGGNAYDCSHGLKCGGSGGHGIVGDSVVVLGASFITGGRVGVSTEPSCRRSPVPGLAADGSVLIAADAAVNGGLGNGARRIASLAWIDSPGVATIGSPVTLKIRGVPGTWLGLFLDERFTNTPVDGLVTPLMITISAIFIGAFPIDTTGSIPLSFTVPADGSLRGQSRFFQAFAFEPASQMISLTNLGDLILR